MRILVGVLASLLLVGTALAAGSCDNVLLKNSEIKTRFGEANILASPATAGASLKICQHLAGKDVCVKDAGFDALASAIDTFKSTFVQKGNQAAKKEFGGAADKADKTSMDACQSQMMLYGAWLSFSAAALIKAPTATSVAYEEFFKNKDAALKEMNKESTSTESEDMKKNFKDMRNLEKNAIKAKADCAKGVIRHFIGVSCLAADASNASSIVTGTAEAPVVKIRKGFCQSLMGQCKRYFETTRQLHQVAEAANLCNNATIIAVADLLKGSYSESVNTQLNTKWNEFKVAAVTGGMNMGDSTKFSVKCSEKNSNSADCDFICQNILTSTGFKVDAFNNLDQSSTTRLLATSGGIEFVDDSSSTPAYNPEQIAMTDAQITVAEQSTTTTSNSAALFVKLAALVAAVSALLL